MEFIAVNNFNTMQHYKNRHPPWIKLYRFLWGQREFFRLKDVSKAHLIGLFSLASQHENKIPLDPEWIAREIGATEQIDLDALFASGYIITWNPDASIVLAGCKQSAIPSREEKRQRKEEKICASQRIIPKPIDPKAYTGGAIPSCLLCRDAGRFGDGRRCTCEAGQDKPETCKLCAGSGKIGTKYRCVCESGQQYAGQLDVYPAAQG
jgi:hypothetical protein